MNYRKLTTRLSAASVAAVTLVASGCSIMVDEPSKTAARETTTTVFSEETTEATTTTTEEETTAATTESLYVEDVSEDNVQAEEIPSVSLADGELFELDLPRPACNIVFERNVENGTKFTEDTLEEYTNMFVMVGSESEEDMIYIVTGELSDAALNAYISELTEYGFIAIDSRNTHYFGYTEEGCSVLVQPIDTEQHTYTIRYSGSTDYSDSLMNVG